MLIGGKQQHIEGKKSFYKTLTYHLPVSETLKKRKQKLLK